MATPYRNRLKLLSRVVLSVGLLALLACSIDLGEMASLLVGVRWEFFAFLLALSLIDRLLSAWKWRILLSAHGNTLGLWPLFRIQMTSGFFGLFLPTALGMDVLRMVAISRCSANPVQAVAASAVDRGISVFVSLFLAAVTAFIAAGTYLSWPVALAFPILLLGFSGTLAIITLPALNNWLAPLVLKVLGVSTTAKLREFYASLLLFRQQKTILVMNAALFGGSICIRIGIVSLQAVALNIQADPLLLALVLPLIWVAMMLPISLGGLGLQEGAYFVFMRGIGVGGSAAVALSLIEQVIARVASLPGLYFYLRGGLAGGAVKPGKSA